MFNQIDDVYNWIYNQKKINRRTDLDRIKRCIKELDLTPNYDICHSAGTNGKGSVAEMLNKCAIEAGYKVRKIYITTFD